MRILCSLLIALGLSLVTGHGVARADAGSEAVRAARLLRAWQFDEAKSIIEKLVKDDAKAEESRYLQGELDFYEGRYDKVVSGLEGLADDELDGNVGALRSLAASSYQVTKGFSVKTSSGGHFKIYYGDKDKVIVDLTGEVLEAAYAALGEDLGHRPQSPIRVELLGAPSDLAKVSTLTEKEIETTGTIALCKYGKLMVVSPRATVFGYPWMDTLNHEYVHFVVTQMSHDNVPVWLHEGLARYLQIRWRGPASGALGSMDENLLVEGLKNNKLVSFDDMHPSMAKLPSQEAAALAFAEVSTMVDYVHQTVGNAGLRKAILDIKRGGSAKKAVAEAMGVEWKVLEADWIRHLKGARLQSKRFADRGHQIRFRKGKGDDENVGVEQIKSEKARKFTRLAGMLHTRGRSAAAALEYEKAVAITGSDDPLIAGKLSRVYLDLGRFTEAIALAEPLLSIDEMDPLPPTTLGAAKLASGDLPGASRAFELALRISPFDSRVRCGLADSYAQSGDKRAPEEREACEYLQQVR